MAFFAASRDSTDAEIFLYLPQARGAKKSMRNWLGGRPRRSKKSMILCFGAAKPRKLFCLGPAQPRNRNDAFGWGPPSQEKNDMLSWGPTSQEIYGPALESLGKQGKGNLTKIQDNPNKQNTTKSCSFPNISLSSKSAT